ncbi:MAG: Fis family transcriptional regulator [Psychrobacter glaciei]|jgi:Fis family transcriptional regulator
MSTHESNVATNQNPAENGMLPADNTQTLRDSVEKALESYFAQLDGQPVTEVYDLVLSEVEAPLLEVVMRYTKDNQTKASVLLGLNRGTLRKKLKQYGML